MNVERTIRLYPVYQALRGALFWMPVFFLYLSSRVTVAEVLVLEAVYYAAVVMFEVPSGYLSDRVGRRPTLVLAAAAWAMSSLLFAAAGDLAGLAAAQVVLAAGMALNSGTDASLLFDSLEAVGRRGAYGATEGAAASWGLIAMAVASVVGGLAGGVDLRLPYLLSAVAGVGATAVALAFVEPPRTEVAPGIVEQGRRVVRHLGDPILRWVLLVSVAMTVFAHVPYEWLQPWLGFLVGDPALAATPILAGAVTAVTLLVAAWASRRAAALRRRLGTRRALLVALAAQVVQIGGMAIAIHPVLVPVLLARGVPGAWLRPIAAAAAQERLPASLRATWLSVTSLAGRLAFSLSLLATSAAIGDASLSPTVLRAVLIAFAALGAVVVGALLLLPPHRGQS